MAINKHALIRYRTLDKCFRNFGRTYFIDDLISEINKALSEIDPTSSGISKRTLYKDINFMESESGWEVDLIKRHDGHKVYYQYKDRSFSIENLPLNEDQANQLQSSIEILCKFKGLPQFDWVEEILLKLKLGTRRNTDVKTIMQFESNPDLKKIEILGDLFNAICYKKILTIKYQPFQCDAPYNWTLHPYYLKQYHNRWFLLGYNPDFKNDTWNLAIDRIVSFEEIQGEYRENENIDWNEYFDDFIGITKPDGAKLEEVVLNIIGKTAHYFITKPIHRSQKSKWIDNGPLQITLNIIINRELENLLLSNADSIMIIQPQHLHKKIKGRLINALSAFNNHEQNCYCE